MTRKYKAPEPTPRPVTITAKAVAQFEEVRVNGPFNMGTQRQAMAKWAQENGYSDLAAVATNLDDYCYLIAHYGPLLIEFGVERLT